MSLLTTLRQRYDQVAREAGKFGVVGLINTVLDFGILNMLIYAFGVQTLTAKIISTIIAATSSFLMNRYWTFRHRENQQVHREYILFFGLNAVGLGIALSVLWVVTEQLGYSGPIAVNIANFIGVGLGTLFRFWSYRRFVWVAPQAVEEADLDGDAAAHAVLAERDQASA